jgi:[acyl-carrier-protein] S-malonyltransferase
MGKLGAVFPGQGSQHIGMGQNFFDRFKEARDIFAEASEVLKIDMQNLCFNGPQEALDLTVNTQTCLLTVSVAAYRIFEAETGIKPSIMAGHSLGEYSALCAAGAFEFADALRLIHARARCQQEAVPIGEGSMAALIGIDRESVEAICSDISGDGHIVELANMNSPNQFVISGHVKAVETAIERAKDEGARMGIKLPISIPSHCSLLRDAAERFEETLKEITIREFSSEVIPNCDPHVLHSKENTRELLKRQLYSPVKWQETVEKMAQGEIDTVVEVGPKRVLSGLIKRIVPSMGIINVEDSDSLKKATEFLKDSQ